MNVGFALASMVFRTATRQPACCADLPGCGCDVSEAGGLSILGFMLITRGVFGGALGLLLALGFRLEKTNWFKIVGRMGVVCLLL